LYRFGQYLSTEATRGVRLSLRIPYSVILRFVRYLVGIHLYPESQIGPGLYIGHYGGIWISPKATLGANCNVSQGVTIGVAGTRAGPVLGDRVWVGPHAVITGPARIGSGAVIAANSFVTTNVPENAMAVGVPARVIADSGSAELIRFPL
jgi:serine O-acetyltransferase